VKHSRAQRDDEQQEGRDGKTHVAQCEQLAAVDAVGDVTGEQKQKDGREKLDETRQAEVQRAVIDFLDLPAHRDGLHLRAKDDAESRGLVQAETGEAEGGGASGDGLMGSRHSLVVCHSLDCRRTFGISNFGYQISAISNQEAKRKNERNAQAGSE